MEGVGRAQPDYLIEQAKTTCRHVSSTGRQGIGSKDFSRNQLLILRRRNLQLLKTVLVVELIRLRDALFSSEKRSHSRISLRALSLNNLLGDSDFSALPEILSERGKDLVEHTV